MVVGIVAAKAGGTYNLLKCNGHEGAWTVNATAPSQHGTITFTIPEGGTSAEGHAVYDFESGGASTHWDLRGPVTFIPAESEKPARINFGTMTGTAKVTIMGQSHTSPNEQLPFWLDLEAGDFLQVT